MNKIYGFDGEVILFSVPLRNVCVALLVKDLLLLLKLGSRHAAQMTLVLSE